MLVIEALANGGGVGGKCMRREAPDSLILQIHKHIKLYDPNISTVLLVETGQQLQCS
jgi:hypothetical protein